MRTLLVAAAFAVFAATALASQRGNADQCAGYMSCSACVRDFLCGWCSEPTVGPNNVTGAQCAGSNPNGTNPFTCNGIFSTITCRQGYQCNQNNFTCELAPPGQGVSKAVCDAKCTNHGQVYLCNNKTKACYEVPPGTPGATSAAICDPECAHPSPNPNPPPPPTNVTLYACNFTSGQCAPAPVGKGSSQSACQATCKKTGKDKYMCNKFLQKCTKLPPGVPGGHSLQQCDLQCNPPPVPGPPPALLGGNFRGIRIDNGYSTAPSTTIGIGEGDLQIPNATTVILRTVTPGNVRVYNVGTPSHISGSSDNEMWVTITSGPATGDVFKLISVTSQLPGPETTFTVFAISGPNGPTPTSITAAMSGSDGQQVFAAGSCLSQACVFRNLNPGLGARGAAVAAAMRKLVTKKKARLAATLSVGGSIGDAVRIAAGVSKPRKNSGLQGMAFNDSCSQHAQSCQTCISCRYCGWCSNNVTYKDGSEGTQCAGPHDNTTNFVCTGRYSTFACTTGYACDNTTWQCVPVAVGNGIPYADCKLGCEPTPAPPPPQAQYVCNVTSKQCFPCNETHCPGSMPRGACPSACANPKKGPHANLIGIWRGLRIEHGYPVVGEYETVFDNRTASFYVNNVYAYKANITSFGADVMLFKILDGQYQGWSFGATYQLSTQYNGLYTQMTFAKGVLGQAFPSSYDEAMITAGMKEWIYVKCEQAPCSFVQP